MLQRIRHFRTSKNTDIKSLLIGKLQLEDSRVDFLLHLGAIYLNENRILQNSELKPNDILRVHLEPKRFPMMNWNSKDCTIYEHNDFIVINKAKGIPSGPSLDNFRENVLCEMQSILGKKLWLPHRLDIGTSGLLLLAKNAEFAAWFSNQLEKRKVLKIYSAEVEGLKPEIGLHHHWMRKSNRSPKILSREPVDGWLDCELEILAIKEKAPRQFSLKIQLHTGRTHQIRAQLSFEGYPILGDGLYQEGKALNPEEFQLACTELGFTFQGQMIHLKLDQ